jgi:hypothetical protein
LISSLQSVAIPQNKEGYIEGSWFPLCVGPGELKTFFIEDDSTLWVVLELGD